MRVYTSHGTKPAAFSPDALRGGGLTSNAALRAEVVPGHARENARSDVTNDTAQGELFGEEKNEEVRASRQAWAWLLRRVFAVEVLVCAHCAGNLRLVEIATEATAIKRIIRDERRRRGEPVSEMEARALPRGHADKFWAVALACQKERNAVAARPGGIGVRVIG